MDKTTVIENKATSADRRAVYLTQEEETTLRLLLAKRAGEWPRVSRPGSGPGDVEPGRDSLVAANPPSPLELELEEARAVAKAAYDAAMAKIFAEAKKQNRGEVPEAFMLTPETPGWMQVEEAGEALERATIRLRTEQARRDYRIAYQRAHEGEDGIADKVRRLLGA